MNVRRLMSAFMIALAVSILCTWLLSRKMTAHATERAPELRYVASNKALQAGEVLHPENLVVITWPEESAVTGGFVKPEELVGRSVLYPLDKNQPITEKYLSTPGAGIGLAGRIPTGMRAIALRSDEVMGVAGFVFPGSHLDVMVTIRAERAPEPTTFTVLQDAEVLAVGQKFQPDPDGKPATATVVTLLLTPQDAERAVMASTQGAFHFVLRSGSDRGQVEDSPVSLSKIAGLGTPVQVSVQSAPKARIAAAHPIATHSNQVVVETIAGDKQTSDSFGETR